MTKRGYLEISFGWLFAIIAGAAILIFAIFLATKIAGIGQMSSSAETQRTIENELNLLESSSESAIVRAMEFSTDTRIYNSCNAGGSFGKQYIGATHRSFRGWPEEPFEQNMVSSQGKYLFSNKVAQGRKFSLFSKQFNLAFKVADMIYITSLNDKYCFVSSPQEIETELSNLNQANIFLNASRGDCPDNSTKICFGSDSKCDVQIFYSQGKAVKNRETVYFYSDSLMYSAIFSDKEIYECELKRLMLRTKSLLELYLRKSDILTERNCANVELISIMQELRNLISSFEDSSDLNQIGILLEQINIQNEKQTEACRIW